MITSTIDWNQFESQNKNPRVDFENLARLLFSEFYCKEGVTLHSNPNNPGIEVDPVCGKNGKNVSFQAKYFDNRINYSDIRESCQKAVKYYADTLDVIYLYCNQDVTVTSESYKSCEEILSAANICLIPVTNQEILNQVLKIDYVKAYFFGGYVIDSNWCSNITKKSQGGLGKRYNSRFNVTTNTEQALELFCNMEEAVTLINHKKAEAVDYFTNHYFSEFNGLVGSIKSIISSLPDIKIDSIFEYKKWTDAFDTVVIELQDKLNKIEDKIEKSNEEDAYRTSLNTIYSQRNSILGIQNQIEQLCCSRIESRLIESQLLFLRGDAGTGKSHCLCEAALKLSKKASGFLVLGTNFITDEHAEIQLMKNLGIKDLQIEDILNIMQCLGKKNNRPMILFIDAINESSSKKIWRSLINKLQVCLKDYPNVKVVISYRSGYEQLLFGSEWENILKTQGTSVFEHNGFADNSVEAIKEFFNYYKIVFSPEYLFCYEFQNPLFLQMYCETYDGTSADINLPSIFEKVIKQADVDVKRQLLMEDIESNLVESFVKAIAAYMIKAESYRISAKELKKLSFWAEEGIDSKKLQFISAITRTNLIIAYAHNDEEYYYLGYNLLQDYVIAKNIIALCANAEELNTYVLKKLLHVNNGKILKHNNVDVYIILCALSRIRFNKENVGEVLEALGEEERFEKKHLLDEYVKSFEWRNVDKNTAEYLFSLVRQYGVPVQTFLDVLLSNSLKAKSAINADYLHNMLLSMNLVHRDSFWTTYINSKDQEGVRAYELIELAEKYEDLNVTESCLKLILKLFSWILTSSNRRLRDHCSKAIIAVLTKNIGLCKWLLSEFETVDDPYVLQRLYACVYGAILRCSDIDLTQYNELAKYVYFTVFKGENTYPDILLRDFAFGILDRWSHDNPNVDIQISRESFSPSYGCEDLPIMQDTSSEYEKLESGAEYIARSMKPDRIPEPGGYGDFGRYIFQSYINEFEDVDVKNAYLYAMDYIFNKIKYNNDDLGEYDKDLGYYRYDRHTRHKVERIGKKYEWISLFNTLAHIADNKQLKEARYEGAWQLFIRDFDPTLSVKMMDDPQAKELFIKNDYNSDFLEEFEIADEEIVQWANSCSKIIDCSKDSLIIKDKNGLEWVKLSQYHTERVEEPGEKNTFFDKKSQIIWNHSLASFVKKEDAEELFAEISDLDFRGDWFPDGYTTTTVFNREYYWSTAYKSQVGIEWSECEIETGETEEIVYENDVLTKIILDYGGDEKRSIDIPKKWTNIIKKKRKICDVLPAYIHFNWEAQYDSSQEETTSFMVPCSELVSTLGLEQKKYDGYFYSDMQLVAYDMTLNGTGHSLIIRKDYLEKFLERKGYVILWTMIGEKQFIKRHNAQIWSEWSGFAHMDEHGLLDGKCWITKKA